MVGADDGMQSRSMPPLGCALQTLDALLTAAVPVMGGARCLEPHRAAQAVRKARSLRDRT